MSLVICSNQDSDAEAVTQKQSIYKAYSFRNALSSTYTIPKNSQVALQSVKYNLNGTFSISGNSYVLYQYYGETIDADVNETIETNSTATPIRTPILDSDNDEVVELTAEELATQLESQMNKYIFHPNLVDLVSVVVKRDATTNEFEGFTITYDQYDTANNTVPATNSAEDLNNNVRVTGDEDWTYSSDGSEGIFTSGEDPLYPQAIILPEYPLSAQNGSFVVDFSDPNGAGVEWAVGLSRYTQTFFDTGEFEPPYYSRVLGGDNQPNEIFFYDYVVCRKNGLLKVYHTPFNSSNRLGGEDYLHSVELDYSGYDVPLDYSLTTNASNFEKVKFTLTGQQLRIQMIDDGDRTADLYVYNSSRVNASQLKVVSQPIWNLYPVLYLEADDTVYGNELVIEQFTACLNLQNWSHDQTYSSYYQNCEILDNLDRCEDIEFRPWNDQNITGRDGYITYADIKSGSNQVIDLENYLIFEPSEVYEPSNGANTRNLLGFTDSPTNNYDYGSGAGNLLKRIFTSTNVPKLLSTKSMFVRLDNFTQQSTNARQGNRSNIIAHLPRFDGQVETGRIYHEPKNLIFLDLNNSNELKVNSFDISFCYSNEQYVTALTGQSVVALYFRQKPS